MWPSLGFRWIADYLLTTCPYFVNLKFYILMQVVLGATFSRL